MKAWNTAGMDALQTLPVPTFLLTKNRKPLYPEFWLSNSLLFSFTVTFSELSAELGLKVDPDLNLKSCDLVFHLGIPENFQFAVVDATSRGYVQLDYGVRGWQTNTYSFTPGTVPHLSKIMQIINVHFENLT